MPKATVATVDHLAKLAHLTLSEQERQLFARQLDEILAYAEAIQKLEIGDVPPMSHASASAVFRDDTPEPGIERAQALGAAPDPEAGLFRVPRVL
jgi:aspartyl-tRNA(Asn)/glutamyl-tRNA(Gln) amidotransferase subunit C